MSVRKTYILLSVTCVKSMEMMPPNFTVWKDEYSVSVTISDFHANMYGAHILCKYFSYSMEQIDLQLDAPIKRTVLVVAHNDDPTMTLRVTLWRQKAEQAAELCGYFFCFSSLLGMNLTTSISDICVL